MSTVYGPITLPQVALNLFRSLNKHLGSYLRHFCLEQPPYCDIFYLGVLELDSSVSWKNARVYQDDMT